MSPDYVHDCTIYAGMGVGGQVLGNTLDDGLYMSTNACIANAQSGTVTWTRLTNGLPAQDITSIVLSPNFATDRTMFVASKTLGIYESTDAGATWSAFDAELCNMHVYRLALAPTDSQSSTLFAATDSGVWQTPVPVAAPPVTLGPGSLTSGSRLVGIGGSQRTTVLTNTRTIPLTIRSITAGGDFAQTNNCGGTLAVGAGCTITVAFTPTATGTRSGSVTIHDSAANSPQMVALTGEGATTITIQAAAGWNMVGGSPLTLWSDSQVTWSFNASTPAWFTPTVTAPTGTGAWEYVSTAGARTVTVVSCPTPVTVPVTAHRWNLVGNPCSRSVSLPSTSRAYWWDPSAQHYVLVTSITPGAAAWVKPDTTTLALS